MNKSLASSVIERKNILNNPFALEHIQNEIGIKSILYDGEYRFTAQQVASFFEVESRTVKRYLLKYESELKQNGYEVISGERLKEFKKLALKDPRDMNVPTIRIPPRTSILGLFNFRAFINFSMLLQESEKARVLRSLILNIVVDIVSQKAGGSTKYINQRDELYLISLYAGENYTKIFIEALKNYVNLGNFKYSVYTNKIYKSIFKEKAEEYRTILSLEDGENVRDTMYSEVLTTISMYESGLASRIKIESKKKKRKLTIQEVDDIFTTFEKDPAWQPQIDIVRRKMASRDYGLRFVIHPELTDYINPLDTPEFERFLGEKSKELAQRVKEYQEVFKRLKDK